MRPSWRLRLVAAAIVAATCVQALPPAAVGEQKGGDSDVETRAARRMRLEVNTNAAGDGRAPSCGGCQRRESMLANSLRLERYGSLLANLGFRGLLLAILGLALLGLLLSKLPRELLKTVGCIFLYMVASPTAILLNKILMKDVGFGYPVLVSTLGQTMTAVSAFVAVRFFGVSVETGRRVDRWSFLILGGMSAFALVLGQYPYLYLTVAFIQMLKAFSPAYMVVFLYCLGVERPSRRVIACVLGLSLCTCVASAGEVNFSVVGVLFMAAASMSDALRLVIAQRLLRNQKMGPIETLYFISPICILWMVPAALLTELPTAFRSNSLRLFAEHPALFIASGIAGAGVNFTSFLLVKRLSAMTLKTLTMARNGGLVIVSAVVMGETITRLEGIGYSGLLLCFGAYTLVKAAEARGAAAVGASEAELKPLGGEMRRVDSIDSDADELGPAAAGVPDARRDA